MLVYNALCAVNDSFRSKQKSTNHNFDGVKFRVKDGKSGENNHNLHWRFTAQFLAAYEYDD